MGKNNVVRLAGRDTNADPLTELLSAGAEQLIHQAVEAELEEFLVEHSGRRTEDGKARCRAQRLSARAANCRGDWGR